MEKKYFIYHNEIYIYKQRYNTKFYNINWKNLNIK